MKIMVRGKELSDDKGKTRERIIGKEKGRRPSYKQWYRQCEREKEDLKRALDEEKAKTKEYLDRLQYLQADFENYMKRMKRDSEEAIKRGNENIIEKFLPILEDLERSVEIGRNSGDNTQLQEGVEMILKEVNQILQGEGLKRLDPVGKPFNPDHHEAVGLVITDEFPEDTVVKELRKGYLLNGRVIRTSMVEVAKKGELE